MSQHTSDYVQKLTAQLKAALRSDLYHNEHEQNREWAMEDLAAAFPDYTDSPYWPYTGLGDDYDNNVMIESEALAAIDEVAGMILPDLLEKPAMEQEQMEDAISDAANDFFSNDVWGNYGVGAYYTDENNGVYTLSEFVNFLKTGQKPAPERLNRTVFTG